MCRTLVGYLRPEKGLEMKPKKPPIPVLGSAMKYSPMSLSSQDAQLVEAWRMSVEDIARAFKTPPPLIGHLDDATLSNVASLMNFWAKTGLGFLVNHIEQMLTSFFLCHQIKASNWMWSHCCVEASKSGRKATTLASQKTSSHRMKSANVEALRPSLVATNRASNRK
jgi:Phage portal protein